MTTTSADDPGQATEQEQIDRLEQRQERTEGKLDELIGLVKGVLPWQPRQAQAQPSQQDDQPAGRPPTVEEQVRAELARGKAEADAAAQADTDKSEAETLRERVAKLEEKQPAPPQPRRERLMWGPK
jgi:hypothetical protein